MKKNTQFCYNRNMNIKHKTLLLLVIASLFSLTGCIDVVDLGNQIDAQPKLVLYSRLCPQLDSTYILLTTSDVLYSSSNSSGGISNSVADINVIKDGIVELSSDGHHWTMAKFDEVRQQYLLTQDEFPIEEGRTYYIRASHEGYPDVSASCTVPYTRNVNFHFDIVDAQGDVHWGEVCNEPHKDLYAEWTDFPGEQNYYMLATKRILICHHYAYNNITHSYEEDSTTYALDWFTPGLENENGSYISVFSDEGKDGRVMRGLLEEFYDEPDYEDLDFQGQYYLLLLDKSCYLYEKSLYENDFAGLSFLMLEPMHTYSNIKNGFGLFGAFCMQAVSF